MAEVLLDTLGLARRLRERAGFSPEHAEETAQAIADAFSGPVATHAGLVELRGDVRAELAAIRAEMSDLRMELRSEMTELGTSLRADMAKLKAELRAEVSEFKTELRTEIADVRSTMERRFDEQRLGFKADLAEQRSDMTRLVLTVATGQVALLLAAMFSLVRLGH